MCQECNCVLMLNVRCVMCNVWCVECNCSTFVLIMSTFLTAWAPQLQQQWSRVSTVMTGAGDGESRVSFYVRVIIIPIINPLSSSPITDWTEIDGISGHFLLICVCSFGFPLFFLFIEYVIEFLWSIHEEIPCLKWCEVWRYFSILHPRSKSPDPY